jgi:hypothetical protein
MKPVHQCIPHQTFDLTEGKLVRKPDGSVVMHFPKKWEALPRQTMPTNTPGRMVDWVPYLITEWEEIPLPSEVK